MSVVHIDNVKLLSQILSDHPLRIENSDKFKQFMNVQLNDIHNSRFKYGNDLTKMNKELIRRFQNIITTQTFKPVRNVEPEEPVPKIKIFETQLKEQQEHFNSLIKVNVPDAIDFSDKTVEPMESESLDATAQKRIDDLATIMSSFNDKDKKNGEEWIKGSQTSDNLKTEKRVTFKVTDIQGVPDTVKTDVTNSVTDSFFSKLKPTKPKITDYNIKSDYSIFFSQIIENQTLIIAELVKLNSTKPSISGDDLSRSLTI